MEDIEKIEIFCSRGKAGRTLASVHIAIGALMHSEIQEEVKQVTIRDLKEIITALDECINAPLPFRRMTEEEIKKLDEI